MPSNGRLERSDWLDRLEQAAATHKITISQPEECNLQQEEGDEVLCPYDTSIKMDSSRAQAWTKPLSGAPEYSATIKNTKMLGDEDRSTCPLVLMLRKLESRIEQMEQQHRREMVLANNRVDTMAALAKHPNSGRADRSAAVLQAAVRRRACTLAYARMQSAVCKLQRASRRQLTWKKMVSRRKSVIALQAALRRHRTLILYAQMRAKIACYVVAQRLARGRAARLRLASTKRNATHIQAWWRGIAPRRAFLASKRAARAIQRCERTFARRFLRQPTKTRLLRERLALERRLADAEAKVHHLLHGKQAAVDGLRGQLAEIITATITCDLCFKIPDFMQVSCRLA